MNFNIWILILLFHFVISFSVSIFFFICSLAIVFLSVCVRAIVMFVFIDGSPVFEVVVFVLRVVFPLFLVFGGRLSIRILLDGICSLSLRLGFGILVFLEVCRVLCCF